MKTVFYALLTILALALPAGAAERRIALVVGNANYQTGSLPTPANDAGLVAQTLQAAGFDVAGARDLDQESLRRAFRDFLDKASSSGPHGRIHLPLGIWRAAGGRELFRSCRRAHCE